MKDQKIDKDNDNEIKENKFLDYSISNHNDEIKEKEIQDNQEENNFLKKISKIMTVLFSLFLIFLLLIFIIPNEVFTSNPEPYKMITLKELEEQGFLSLQITNPIQENNATHYEELIYYRSNPSREIVTIASKIASDSCLSSNEVCYAKALFYFVRDNIKYIKDPVHLEHIESPMEVLITGAADCDGKAVLLSSLLTSIGIENRYVLIDNHIFVEIKIDNARKYYFQKDGYIALDPTCKSCDFGEVPYTNLFSEWKYL